MGNKTHVADLGGNGMEWNEKETEVTPYRERDAKIRSFLWYLERDNFSEMR